MQCMMESFTSQAVIELFLSYELFTIEEVQYVSLINE